MEETKTNSMRTVEIKGTIMIPEGEESATQTQIQEWIEFQMGAVARISVANPLHAYNIESDNIQITEW